MNGVGPDDQNQYSVDLIPLAKGPNGTTKTCIPPKGIPTFRASPLIGMSINGLPYYAGLDRNDSYFYDPEINSWPEGGSMYLRTYHGVKMEEDLYWVTGNVLVEVSLVF